MPNRKNESHHYVPQFYLRHWCDADGKLWVYPAETGHGFRATPKNFAAENGLYDSSDIPHLSSIDFEGRFSQIECLFDSRWPEVFNGTMDPATKMNISRFLALMHLRHPKQRESVRETNEWFRKMARQTKSAGHDRFEIVDPAGKRMTVTLDEVEQFAGDTPAHLKAGFLNSLHGSVENLAEILFARKWGVIFNTVDKPVFLTSDTPLLLHRGTSEKAKYGFGTPGTEITFPITPTKLLRISDVYERDGLHYPLLAIGDVNEQLIMHADRFIFSPVELVDPDGK